jgi:hypothetical protein
MSNKQKGKRNVRHELENEAEYQGLSDTPTIDLNGEMISEKEYMRRFNDEWYYASRNGEHTIMETKEQKAETERNNNRNKRDTMSVAERTGTLVELTDNESDFMDQASNEWEWQDVYKMAGPTEARHVIFEQAKRDIEAGVIDLDVTLSRFAIKMYKFKTLNERKRKQKGKV